MLQSVGPAWEPDLVVLAFYEGNDYLNNGEARDGGRSSTATSPT